MSAYYSKILGTYEMELREVIHELADAAPKKVINVGAAEGYFAVGLARKLQKVEVIAFESSESARNMLRELSTLNGVDSKINLNEECAKERLKQAINGESEVALIVDIEGGEKELLSPDEIKDLSALSILVEVHERNDPNLGEKLKNRFKATHIIQEITARERQFEDLPFNFPKSLQATFIGRWVKLMMDEQRGDGRLWLYLKPK